MEIDQALEKLGRRGRWQIGSYIMIALATCTLASMHTLLIIFIGAEGDHHCKADTYLRPLEETFPMEEYYGEIHYSQCNMYDISPNETFSNSTPIVPCKDGHEFYFDKYGKTIITDFGLVCDKAILVEHTQLAYDLGMVFADIVFTGFSDRFGRKPVFFGCHWGLMIMTVVTAFAQSYEVFTFARFFCGAFAEGLLYTGYALACELLPSSQRTYSGTICMVFWPLGSLILGFMAYFIKDWRYLQIAVAIPGIFTIPMFWLVSESIPWLVSVDRYKDADAIIRKAAKVNKVVLPDVVLMTPDREAMAKEEEDEEGDKKQNTGCCSNGGQGCLARLRACCSCKKEDNVKRRHPTFRDVLKSRKMLLFTLIMTYLWCVNALVYYGIHLSIETIAGDLYVNFFLITSVELVAFISCIFILQKFGRRRPLILFHVVAGVALVCTIPIPLYTEGGTSLIPLIVTLAMVAKAGISASFGTVFLYALELYPTPVRNFCMGVCAIGLNIGGFLAPYSSHVAEAFPWLPNTIFGFLSITAGFTVLYFPETLNRRLPESIEEVENFSRMPIRIEDRDLKDRQELVLTDNGNTYTVKV